MKLLSDSPAGGDTPEFVRFNHVLYANLLRDVLLQNRSGVCVGFFARWGHGKSTVINLLNKAISTQAKIVLFNAYHARGDSVRRQMILTVLRQIEPEKADEFERFSQTGTALEFATAEEKDRRSGTALIKLLLTGKERDPFLIVAAICAIGCTTFFLVRGVQVMFGAETFAESGDLIAWLAGGVAWSLTVIWRLIGERRDKIIAYTQPVSDSQRLRYPEQFAKVFANSVHNFNRKENTRLIVVIDDLDRCDPSTVVEALASMRQFTQEAERRKLNCQFVIPCDDGQLIAALETDGHFNYSEGEMLRKFFEIIVRMDEIVPESLADFAATEAAKLGIADELARNMVDSAALREPRKVKSVLNAYKVSQEVVLRSQSLKLLPTADKLDRFEQTLAILVCLQELAPKAFHAVKDNLDLLDQPEQLEVLDPLARRIIAGLGPASLAVADILITKQSEPSLQLVPQGHPFATAVRTYQYEEAAKLLKDASEQGRTVLIDWLGRKIREAKSSSRIREIIGYILDFGAVNGWQNPAINRALLNLRRHQQHLPEALRFAARMDKWISYCVTLAPSQRHDYDEIHFNNYRRGTSGHPGEQKYLLRFGNSLPRSVADEFTSSLRSDLIRDSFDQTFLEQLASNLGEGDSGAWQFAPELGVQLSKHVLPRKPKPEVREAATKVALTFIGADVAAADRLVSELIDPETRSLPRLSQIESQERAYFDLLRGLLKPLDQLPAFAELFRKSHSNWFNSQSDLEGRFFLISSLQPAWGIVQKEGIDEIATQILPWIWHDVEFSEKAVQAIDSPVHDKPGWRDGIQSLHRAIAARVADNCRGNHVLSPAIKAFLKSVAQAKWQVGDQAEKLLHDFARRLNPNQGDQVSNVTEWLEFLLPLCRSIDGLQNILRDNLSNNSKPADVLEVGLKTVWKSEIPLDTSAPIANALLQFPNLLLSTAVSEELPTRRGFSEVMRVFLTHLRSKSPEWMHERKEHFQNVSKLVSTNRELSAEFQSVIEVLLTSERIDFFETGLQLLESHTTILPVVKRSIDGWLNRGQDAGAKATHARTIMSRPDLVS